MAKQIVEEDVLNLVSGGVLLDGWDQALINIMSLFKARYGEEGYQKVWDLVEVSINDPTSPVTQEDAATMYKFIEDNWASVVPWEL